MQSKRGQRCLLLTLSLLLTACAPERTVTREVVVTQVVEVTREVVREVTREVTRVQTIEVTREVTMEVTVVALATAALTAESSPDVPTPSTTEPPTLATTLSIVEEGNPTAPTCWGWQEAAQHIGESGCVEGTVTGVGGTESVFFINFSPDRTSFYGVSFDWVWEELAGECLRLDGTLSEFRGRPQLIIEDPTTQVHYCNAPDSPPAFAR